MTTPFTGSLVCVKNNQQGQTSYGYILGLNTEDDAKG